MTSSDPPRSNVGHIIDIVTRRDVEDYAEGRLHHTDTVRLVENALLEDDAARAVVRAAISGTKHKDDSIRSQGRLFEPLRDLSAIVRSCRTLAVTYDQLCASVDYAAAAEFLDKRAAAFRKAANKLTGPLSEQVVGIPAAWPEEATLFAPESRNTLVRQISEEPTRAAGVLADLHRSMMEGLRTLIHVPWPLRTKLLIAETYALLTEELETGAWKLKRRLSGR